MNATLETIKLLRAELHERVECGDWRGVKLLADAIGALERAYYLNRRERVPC